MNSSKRIPVFDENNFYLLCDHLARLDKKIEKLIDRYGYPVLKKRAQGFEGIVRLILEQQVSLASALSALDKLGNMAGGIGPKRMLALDKESFRACGVSRQKTRYITVLSQMVVSGDLDAAALARQDNGSIRKQLMSIPGIGPWTCDCYLLLCLQRADIFPMGDLALIKSIKENELVGQDATPQQVKTVIDQYRPYRSVLAKLLWHAYLERRGIQPH